jgi:hypothetical protein
MDCGYIDVVVDYGAPRAECAARFKFFSPTDISWQVHHGPPSRPVPPELDDLGLKHH